MAKTSTSELPNGVHSDPQAILEIRRELDELRMFCQSELEKLNAQMIELTRYVMTIVDRYGR